MSRPHPLPATGAGSSNYVQYGRTDYICSGFHNGSTCSNGMRFRIAEIEKAVLDKLELDYLSPEALSRAADLAMEYLNKQQNSQQPPAPPETAAALSDIDARQPSSKPGWQNSHESAKH